MGRETQEAVSVGELSAQDPQGRQSGYGWGMDSVGYSRPSKPGLNLGTLSLTCIYPDLPRVVGVFLSWERPSAKWEARKPLRAGH